MPCWSSGVNSIKETCLLDHGPAGSWTCGGGVRIKWLNHLKGTFRCDKSLRHQNDCPQYIPKGKQTPASKLAFVKIIYCTIYLMYSHWTLHGLSELRSRQLRIIMYSSIGTMYYMQAMGIRTGFQLVLQEDAQPRGLESNDPTVPCLKRVLVTVFG